MNKLFALLLVLSFSYNLFCQNFNKQNELSKFRSIKSTTPSKVAYPGDSTIDVTYYKLDLNIKYQPSDYLKAIVTIGAKSVKSSLNNFFLDLQNSLTVDSVLLNNKKLVFIHDNAKLNIKLGQTYSNGEKFSVKIYYQGVPGATGFGSFIFGQHNNGDPSIWSLSEPYGASDWWPCKDTPGDKADSSDVWITCDGALTGVSNGTLISVDENPDGTKTYKWKNQYPIAQYLISVAISNYRKYVTYFHYAVNDSMPIENFVYPEYFNTAKADIDKTANMLKIFSDRFGLYPFIKEKYGQVQFGWGGGMEHQTITSLGGFGEDIQAHELAHQWFGDKVTCADWNDIWLNEGFATYSEAVYFEATGGEGAYGNMISNDMNNAKNAIGSVYVNDISSIAQIFDSDRSYAKGAVVLHMLRGIVGDSTFFKILRTYLVDPKLSYNVATTGDFQRVAESVYGSSLDYFFKEWIYGQNFPSYTVTWSNEDAGNNIYNISLNIYQANNGDPVFFTMPIKIKISTSIKDTVVTVFNDKMDQTFNFSVEGKPTDLIFDPYNQILKQVAILDSIDLTKPQSFDLLQNYPNPFNPGTKILFSIPVTKKGFVPVKLQVYNSLGQLVKTLINEEKPSGSYQVIFDGKDLPSGVYIYRLTSGTYTISKKMMLLK